MPDRRHKELAETLRQRFFSGLHLGLLEPGSRLPSVRELQNELGVDRRVVIKAYRELEHEGLVELRERSGIYFASSVPGQSRAPRSMPLEWTVDIAARALESGIAAPDLPRHFQDQLRTTRLKACCLECNLDQRGSLCDELMNDYGMDADSVDVFAALENPDAFPALRDADLLVTTRFHAGEVREIAARVGRPWISVALRTDIYAAIARLLPTRPVYFVVADPHYAYKLGLIFNNVKGSANLHPLVAGRDSVDEIEPSAAAYVTRAARTLIQGSRLLDRVPPEDRVFAASSAREILAFVVEANALAVANAQRRSGTG